MNAQLPDEVTLMRYAPPATAIETELEQVAAQVTIGAIVVVPELSCSTAVIVAAPV